VLYSGENSQGFYTFNLLTGTLALHWFQITSELVKLVEKDGYTPFISLYPEEIAEWHLEKKEHWEFSRPSRELFSEKKNSKVQKASTTFSVPSNSYIPKVNPEVIGKPVTVPSTSYMGVQSGQSIHSTDEKINQADKSWITQIEIEPRCQLVSPIWRSSQFQFEIFSKEKASPSSSSNVSQSQQTCRLKVRTFQPRPYSSDSDDPQNLSKSSIQDGITEAMNDLVGKSIILEARG